MKTKLKNFLAVLLVLSLFAGLLSGCAGKSDKKVDENPGNTNDKAPIETTDGALDLKGREIRVLIAEGQIPQEGEPLMESIKQTEAKYNCKFVFKRDPDVIGAYGALVRNHMAGIAEYEAFLMRGYNVVPQYSSSGALLAVSDYYDFANDPVWQHDAVKDLGWWNGKKYGISFSAKAPGYAFWYNKALLREANVPDLWEYVKNDTWTWETFREVCRKLTKDKNNDGKIDQYGFASEDPFLQFVVSNGGKLVDNKNGKATYALNAPEAIEAIQFVLDMFIVDGSIPTNEALQEFARSHFHMMPTGALAIFPYHAWYGPWLQEAGIDPANIGWIYPPKGPKAKDYIIASATEPSMYVIPAMVENPKDVVTVVQDALAIWNPAKKNPVSLEQMLQVTVEDDRMLDIMAEPNTKKLFMEGGSKTVYTYVHNYVLQDHLWLDLWGKLLLQEFGVQTGVDSVKDKMQALIDEASSGKIAK